MIVQLASIVTPDVQVSLFLMIGTNQLLASVLVTDSCSFVSLTWWLSSPVFASNAMQLKQYEIDSGLFTVYFGFESREVSQVKLACAIPLI